MLLKMKNQQDYHQWTLTRNKIITMGTTQFFPRQVVNHQHHNKSKVKVKVLILKVHSWWMYLI